MRRAGLLFGQSKSDFEEVDFDFGQQEFGFVLAVGKSASACGTRRASCNCAAGARASRSSGGPPVTHRTLGYSFRSGILGVVGFEGGRTHAPWTVAWSAWPRREGRGWSVRVVSPSVLGLILFESPVL